MKVSNTNQGLDGVLKLQILNCRPRVEPIRLRVQITCEVYTVSSYPPALVCRCLGVANRSHCATMMAEMPRTQTMER